MDRKYILVGGYAGSGKSACIDFLKETEGTVELGPELRIITDPDGLINLKTVIENCWTPYQIDMAIKRFKKLIKTLSKTNSAPYYGRNFKKILFEDFEKLSMDYIDNITAFKFNGVWFGIDNFFSAFSRRLQNKFKIKLPDFTKEMFIGYPEEEFYTLTKKYIDDLITKTLEFHNNTEAKNIIINEPFASMNGDNMLDLIPDAKIIIVNRDPRDMYMTGYTKKWNFVPRDNIEKFISWYKFMHKRSEKASTNTNNILKINFEDLICKYDETKNKIFSFLQILDKEHVNKLKFLDPKKSIKTIGLWKKYYNQSEMEKMQIELHNYYNFNKEEL